MTKFRAAIAAAFLIMASLFVVTATATPAQAAGYCVYHHTPDAGASGAFILQKGDGSIVYAGQGQQKCNIVRWYVPQGEQIACQSRDGVGPFIVIWGSGWHNVNQNWNSCVTQLAGTGS